MGLKDKLKLILALRKLEGYWKGGPVNGFDPRISLKKGLMSLLRMIAAAVIFGIVSVATDSAAVAKAFAQAGVPEAISAIFAMGIVAAGKALANAWAHVLDPTEPVPPSASQGGK